MLQIILRNKIPQINELCRVTDNYIFVLKRTPNYNRKSKSFHYIMNPCIFRAIDIFSQFQAHYLGITQEECMHILNLLIQAYLELSLI